MPWASWIAEVDLDAGVQTEALMIRHLFAAIKHALFDPNPKLRYMVVPDREEATWTIGASIQRVVQRNERQEHAFSREELIEMLDTAIANENATGE